MLATSIALVLTALAADEAVEVVGAVEVINADALFVVLVVVILMAR
jgi:hypothetical protein